MRVAFRTDASLDIGNGHVMRCLTLAAALREQGANCVFICRAHAGNLIGKIRELGFDVAELPATAADDDARATIDAAGMRLDWLVVDHYGIAAEWERGARSLCDRLLVIDDLADRAHDCDLLLDQNAGRRAEDYRSLVAEHCMVLAGPSWALLRPEFSQARTESLGRSRHAPHRILVSMGGVDKDNMSVQVLRALEGCHFAEAPHITVVLGPHAPWLDDARRQAAAMRWPTQVRVDVADMAQLMAHSDMAIGAAGVSALERCCVGLPSILIPVADNQLPGARALAAAGAAALLDAACVEALPQAVAAFTQAKHLATVSAACAAITAGLAAPALARLMSRRRGHLRPMREADLDTVLAWRNAPQIRQRMRNADPISAESHRAWFTRASADPDRALMIAEAAGQPVGFVQFSGLQHSQAPEWGFYAVPGAPKGSGNLLGRLALDHAFLQLGLPRLLGRTLPDNEASINFHRKLGFCPADADDPTLLSFEILRDDWVRQQESLA